VIVKGLGKDDKNWIRYSTLGIEMAVIIGAAVWGGVALDRKMMLSFPIFTILMSVIGLVVAIARLVIGTK
jgi:hypothetical protein